MIWLLLLPVLGLGGYFYGVRVGLRHGRLDCKRAYELGRQQAIAALMV